MAAVLELEAQLDNLLTTSQKETIDIDLFAPITDREECPICMLPLPYDDNEITFMPCCGKHICSGCIHKGVLTDLANGTPKHETAKCSFCRQKPKNSIKELKKLMKRDNSQAFMQMVFRYNQGEGVIQSDTRALEMLTKAAEFGEAEAFAQLGKYYENGNVIEQDLSKSLEFYELGAKKGSINCHQQLAVFHWRNGNFHKNIQHIKVAASAGDKVSMGALTRFYKDNKDKLLSKDELAQTLRAHQASLNEMKSKERDDAIAFRQLHSGALERLRTR